MILVPPVDTDWDHVWEARSVPGAIILSSVASGAQCLAPARVLWVCTGYLVHCNV